MTGHLQKAICQYLKGKMSSIIQNGKMFWTSCGLTKQHKISREWFCMELHTLQTEHDFPFQKETGRCQFTRICSVSLRFLFPCRSSFLLGSPAGRQYLHLLFSKPLCTWQFISCMISQKSMRSCTDKYQIPAANWCNLRWAPLIIHSWRSGEWGVGLTSNSSCISKITRWCMNEFTADSAFITLGSAGWGAQVCIKQGGR